MFERFTKRAMRTLAIAQEEAVAMGNDFIGTEHVLLALAVEGDGLAGQILRDLDMTEEGLRQDISARTPVAPRLKAEDADALAELGIDLAEVRQRVEATFGEGALPTARAAAGTPFTPLGKKVLEQSLRTALAMGHNYIGTEHLLIGLAVVEDCAAAEMLAAITTADDLRSRVTTKLGGMGHTG